MSNTIEDQVREYLASTDMEEASKLLGAYPSVLKRYAAGTHRPSAEVVTNYVKNVVMAGSGDREWDKHADFAGRNLCLLLPFYKTTNPATAYFLFALALDMGKENIRSYMRHGDAIIENSRNRLVQDFMDSGSEWSLWIDDDMIFPIGRAGLFKHYTSSPPGYPDARAGRHVIHRLMSHKKTLVGGLYFGRHPNAPAMFAEGMKNGPESKAARSGSDSLLPTRWVATGCMLVHRQVYLDIQAKHPEWKNDTTGQGGFTYFHKTPDAGEDVNFCKAALEAGHQPYVDLGLECAHVGYACYGSWNTQGRNS